MMSVQEIADLQERVQRTQYAASLLLGGLTYLISRRAFKSWHWSMKIVMMLLISNAYLTISEWIKRWYIEKKTQEAIASGMATLQQNLPGMVQNVKDQAREMFSGLSLPFSGGGAGVNEPVLTPEPQVSATDAPHGISPSGIPWVYGDTAPEYRNMTGTKPQGE